MHPKRNRRLFPQILIYPKFQLMLVAAQTGVLATGFALIALEARKSYSILRATGADVNLPAGHPYFDFVEMQASTVYSHLAWAFVVVFALSTIATLFLSHRLAGPIVRLTRYFEQIRDERAVPEYALKFRDGDFFEELPAVVNEAMAELKPESKAKAKPAVAKLAAPKRKLKKAS